MTTKMRTATLGDLEIHTHLHEDGTHSIGIVRYGSGSKKERYMNLSLQLTAGDFDALIKVLSDTRAESRHDEAVAAEAIMASKVPAGIETV